MYLKRKIIRETTHILFETYYRFRYYNWKKVGKPVKHPMLVFMVDDAKGFYTGGMADRFKGAVSTYVWCKQRNIDFRIRYVYPFELADYLEPASYDWRLRPGEFTTCLWDTRIMHARREKGRRFVAMKLGKKQLHYHGNVDILEYLNYTGGTNYSWGSMFKELFKPGEKLGMALEREKKKIGDKYISVSFRFQNLLGDFEEYDYQPLTEENKREELIRKCIDGLSNLQKTYVNIPLLVTSDSSTFIERVSQISGIHVIGGRRVHMGCNDKGDYDTHLNSFIDFYMLANSQRIFCLGTAEMYPTKFPMYAAKINDILFERVLIE